MKSQLEVVEVWGIPIRVHLSWVLVFVARRNGILIESITLFVFGGLAPRS